MSRLESRRPWLAIFLEPADVYRGLLRAERAEAGGVHLDPRLERLLCDSGRDVLLFWWKDGQQDGQGETNGTQISMQNTALIDSTWFKNAIPPLYKASFRSRAGVLGSRACTARFSHPVMKGAMVPSTRSSNSRGGRPRLRVKVPRHVSALL